MIVTLAENVKKTNKTNNNNKKKATIISFIAPFYGTINRPAKFDIVTGLPVGFFILQNGAGEPLLSPSWYRARSIESQGMCLYLHHLGTGQQSGSLQTDIAVKGSGKIKDDLITELSIN